MSSIPLYNALMSAGVNEEMATAAVNDVARIEQVATKLDIANMQTSLANMEVRLVKWMLGIAGLAIAIMKLT
jgi:hypothetical protein